MKPPLLIEIAVDNSGKMAVAVNGEVILAEALDKETLESPNMVVLINDEEKTVNVHFGQMTHVESVPLIQH